MHALQLHNAVTSSMHSIFFCFCCCFERFVALCTFLWLYNDSRHTVIDRMCASLTKMLQCSEFQCKSIHFDISAVNHSNICVRIILSCKLKCISWIICLYAHIIQILHKRCDIQKRKTFHATSRRRACEIKSPLRASVMQQQKICFFCMYFLHTARNKMHYKIARVPSNPLMEYQCFCYREIAHMKQFILSFLLLLLYFVFHGGSNAYSAIENGIASAYVPNFPHYYHFFRFSPFFRLPK